MIKILRRMYVWAIVSAAIIYTENNSSHLLGLLQWSVDGRIIPELYQSIVHSLASTLIKSIVPKNTLSCAAGAHSAAQWPFRLKLR